MKTQLLIYSLIAMPLAVVGLPLYIYLPTFYATEVGVSIGMVGVILFIARFSDVITDPFIGILSDISLNKYNSRKPIMFAGFLVMIISFYFLIHPSENYPALHLFIFSVLIYFGWSLVNIPYLSFSSEISNLYYVKTKLNSFREISTILGLVLALSLPYFIPHELIEAKLYDLYILFLVLFIPFFIITILFLQVKSNPIENDFSFFKLKTIYSQDPNLFSFQFGYFLNNLANAIPATLFLLFIEIVIADKTYSEVILILYFFSGVLALPIWMLLSKKIGKKRVWISSILLASTAFFFVLFLKEGDVMAFGIISIISGLSLGADMAFPTSIQSDIVQEKKQNAGLLFGIWTMITKLSLAFCVVVTFGILGLVGFDQDNLTALSIMTLTLLYGLAPIILKLIALFFINRYQEKEIIS